MRALFSGINCSETLRAKNKYRDPQEKEVPLKKNKGKNDGRKKYFK